MTERDERRLREIAAREHRKADDLWDQRQATMNVVRGWRVRLAMRRCLARRERDAGQFDRAACWQRQAGLARDILEAYCEKVDLLFGVALDAELRARLAYEEIEQRNEKPDASWDEIEARMEEAIRDHGILSKTRNQ
jgi:hypothetical protein